MPVAKTLDRFDLQLGDRYKCVSACGDFKNGEIYDVVVDPNTGYPSIIAISGEYYRSTYSLFELFETKTGAIQQLSLKLGEQYVCTNGFNVFTKGKIYTAKAHPTKGVYGFYDDRGKFQTFSVSEFELKSLNEQKEPSLKGYLCFDTDNSAFFYVSEQEVNENAEFLTKVYRISGDVVPSSTIQTKVFFK